MVVAEVVVRTARWRRHCLRWAAVYPFRACCVGRADVMLIDGWRDDDDEMLGAQATKQKLGW